MTGVESKCRFIRDLCGETGRDRTPANTTSKVIQRVIRVTGDVSEKEANNRNEINSPGI